MLGIEGASVRLGGGLYGRPGIPTQTWSPSNRSKL